MLCEEVNDVGPVNYQIPFNEKWIEIEHNKIYYYLRKGYYEHVEEVYHLRSGWKLCEIGENKYIVCL